MVNQQAEPSASSSISGGDQSQNSGNIEASRPPINSSLNIFSASNGDLTPQGCGPMSDSGFSSSSQVNLIGAGGSSSGLMYELSDVASSSEGTQKPSENQLKFASPRYSSGEGQSKLNFSRNDDTLSDSERSEHGKYGQVTTIKPHDKSGSVASTSKTPRSSSSRSKSTTSSEGAIKLRTCCGTLELSWLKVLNLSSLCFNLMAFVILGTIIIVTFVMTSSYSNQLTGLDDDTAYYRHMMIHDARSAAFCNNNKAISDSFILDFANNTKVFMANINVILATVPKHLQYHVAHNMSVNEVRTAKAIGVENMAIALAKTGNYSQAIALLSSPTYKYYLDGFDIEFQPLVDYIQNLKKESLNFSVIITTICLIVICVSILIVVPVMIASIVLSVKKDATNTKKLKQIKAFLLMDTFRDDRLRNLFKNYCKQEMSLDNFLLLDKITDYKCLCEKSFDIQVYLYDSDLSLSDGISEASSVVSEGKKKKKKKGFSEKDLAEVEKKKYEIAFEIYTDYLDVNGEKSVNINKQIADKVKQQLDFFATGQNEHLGDQVFDGVESEICILMLDTHHRFKQTVEFQKQAQKEALRGKLRKKEKAENRKLSSIAVPVRI